MVKNRLDIVRDRNKTVSDSFCPAKWYNTTIWLGNGRTASCHHPEAHYIPPREVFANPAALHNTTFKKEQRKKMLTGERPAECSYCWRVEDVDSDIHSDRTYKSVIYTDEEIEYLKTLAWDADIDPKTVEISFDNLCNLSCSYCNPEFSSTWANDIKKNGIYPDMKTGGGQTYQNDGSHAYAFDPNSDNNFYTKSFFKWFDDSLKDNLHELRVTGGEPTRSPAFWELVEKCQGATFKFAVNSNLIMNQKRLDTFVDCTSKFEHFDLYTSCEAYKDQAELVRHGFKYDEWINNLKYFATNAQYENINIMMTISALSLFSMTDFMDDMIDLKREYKRPGLFNMSFNILRFPSFQSVNIFPTELKLKLADKLDTWLDTRAGFLTDSENNQLQRVILYLREVDKSYEDADSQENKENDFAKFFTTYTSRRDIDIVKTINDTDFEQWWNKING